MKIVIMFLSLACATIHTCAHGSIFTKNDSIVYRISDSLIRWNRKQPTFRLRIEITNKSNYNFILYRFREVTVFSILSDSTDQDMIRVTKNAAINGVFILNAKKQHVEIIPKECDSCKLDIAKIHNPNFKENIRKEIMAKYLAETVVIKKRETKQITVEVDMLHIEKLEKGKYFFYLMYSCGENVSNIIDNDRISMEKKKNRAEVFTGWVKSNMIQFIVE
ncbi:MAG: hypothetical protein JST69_14570 [Bacteroidetes bacterium]|nr:hypothetical protein [Bacteroidota bacterium]